MGNELVLIFVTLSLANVVAVTEIEVCAVPGLMVAVAVPSSLVIAEARARLTPPVLLLSVNSTDLPSIGLPLRSRTLKPTKATEGNTGFATVAIEMDEPLLPAKVIAPTSGG